jgi:HlyD family secretion protein
MSIIKRISNYIRTLRTPYKIGGGIVLVIMLIALIHGVFGGADSPTTTVSGISHVHVATVADLSSQAAPLPLVGKVTSLNQATILAQNAGEIVSVSHALGDRVGAGEVIAQFENSSQAAAVLQAQGAYDGAQAALAKAEGSTAANSGISSTQATTNAQNAQVSVGVALQATYAALDDAIHTKSDTLFSNPRTNSPKLNPFTIPDAQLVINLENKRLLPESQLKDAQTFQGTSASSTASVSQNVSGMISVAQTVLTFLNDMIVAINQAVSNQQESAADIAAAQSTLSAARNEVVSALSSLTGAKSAYDAAIGTAQTAANSAQSGTSSDIAAAQANAKSALGALNAAKANLEKTIIRSPISGTIVSLPISRGDYVSAFSQVSVVSNPNTLEVQVYVTAEDAKTLAVGGKATIENGAASGAIVSIAPALDPTTGKILVKIDVEGDKSVLTDGDTVSVSLARAPRTTTNANVVTIPIIAAKITPQGPTVFTVSASTTLVAVPITLGTILGDRVTVLGGITSDMSIITDARGLSNGQTVVVDSQ